MGAVKSSRTGAASSIGATNVGVKAGELSPVSDES